MQDRTPNPQSESLPATGETSAPQAAPPSSARWRTQLKAYDYASQAAMLAPRADGLAQSAFAGGGVPVQASAAARVLGATGVDVSHARVHTGPAVDAAAGAMGAQGFARGSNVGLAKGADANVLYHELAHVAQQTGGAPSVMGYQAAGLSSPAALEAQADRVADAAMRGGTAPVTLLGSAQMVQPKRKKGRYEMPGADALEDTAARRYVAEAHALMGDKVSGAGELEGHLEALRDGRKKHRRQDGLTWFVDLATEARDVQAAVVAELERTDDFSRLLSFCGYKRIWKDEAAGLAVTALFAHRSPERAFEDISEILLWQPFKTPRDLFDWSTNRWEARMAWEMLLCLPEGMREELLDPDQREALDKQAKRVGKKLDHNKVERNLSWEYKESSRFDTYGGHQAAEASFASLEDGFVRELEATTTEDTDRQGLVARALDPSLWAAEDATRLKATVRMVVQADEAPLLGSLVREHWARHGDWLAELHFDETGAWREVISDDHASNWAQRLVWGAISVFQALRTVVQLGKVRSTSRIDLETLTKAFVGIGGVRLEDTERVQAELTPLDKLRMVVGGAAVAEKLLEVTQASPEEALEALSKGVSAASWVVSLLEAKGDIEEGVDIVREMTGKSEWEPEALDADKDGNTLVIQQNDVSGHTVVSVPLLALGAMARVGGQQTVKLGPSLLAGATVTIKGRTARSTERFVEVRVDRAQLNDLLVSDLDSMLTIGSLEISGLVLKFTASDPRPAAMMEQIAHWIRVVAMQTLEVAPLEQVPYGGGTLGRGLAKFGVGALDGIKTAKTAGEILSGDWQQLEIHFDGFAMHGLATSGGTHVDHLEIGETNLSIDASLTAAVATGGASVVDIDQEIADLEKDQAKARAKLAKSGDRPKRKAELEEQLAWTARKLTRLGALRRVVKRIEDKREDLEAPRKRLAELDAVRHPGESERAEKRDLTAKIQQLEAELAALKTSGMAAEGTLGAVRAEGIQAGGVAVGAVSIAETVFEASADEEGEAQGFVARTAEIAVSDVSVGSDRRRDVAVAQEICQLEIAIEKRQGPATKEQAHRLKALKDELAMLEPFVREYEWLRERMDEHAADDRARFLELREMLRAPASVTVGSAKVQGLEFGLSVSHGGDLTAPMGGDLTGLGWAGAHVDGFEVHDVTLHETAQLTHGGDTHIGRISATDVDLSADASGAELLTRLQAEGATVEDLSVEGLRSAATGDMQALGAIEQDLVARIEALEAIGTLTEDQQTRLEMLKAQLVEVQQAVDAVEAEVIVGQDALLMFIETAPELMANLVGSEGVDWSRGTSYVGLVERGRAALREIEVVVSGDASLPTPVDEQDCLETARSRAESYLMGVTELKYEVTNLQDRIKKLGKGGTITHEREKKLMEKAIADRKGAIAQGTALGIQWEQKIPWLEGRLAAAKADLGESRRLQTEYGIIVDGAVEAGLAGTRYYGSREALEAVSAFQLVKSATAALNGFEDLSVDRVDVTGVDVSVTGVADMLRPMMDKDPDNDEMGGDLTISPGTEGGSMVQSLVVSGVRQGDNALGGIALKNLGGSVTLGPDGTVALKGLSLSEVTLSAVHWDVGDYGVHTDEALTLEGLSVDAVFTSTPTTVTDAEDGQTYGATVTGGMITHLHVDRVSSPALQFRMGDYLIGMKGDADAEQAGLEILGIDLYEMDLATSAMAGLEIGSVDAAQLDADLGGGLTVGAERLHVGDLHISSVVTDQAREAAEGEASANRFDIGVGDIDADQVAIQMQTAGLEVEVAEIRNGKVGNVHMDTHTGEFGVSGVHVGRVRLGPVLYSDGETFFQAHAGLTLNGVELSVHGRMPTAEEIAADRKKGRTPKRFEVMVVDRMFAQTADFKALSFSQSTHKSTEVSVASGHLEALTILDYDLGAASPSFSMAVHNADFNGFSAKLQDTLSTTTLEGSVHLDALAFAAGYDDATGKAFTSVAFQGVRTTEDLAYAGDGTAYDEEGRSSRTETSARVGVDNASGAVDMRGSRTSFSDVSVASVRLPRMQWASTEMAIGARDAKLSKITASGWLETTEYERAGMRLPRTNMHISSLHVERISAGAVQLLMQDEVNVVAGGRRSASDPSQLDTPAMVLTDLQVTNLDYIDGVMEGGLIELESLDGGIRADYESGGIGATNKLLHLISDVHAEGIECRFDAGETTIDVSELAISDVKVRKEFGPKEYLTCGVELAKITGLHGEILQAYSEASGKPKAKDEFYFRVPSLVFQQDGWLDYHRDTSKTAAIDAHQSLSDKADAARAKKKQGQDLAKIDWNELLSSFDGQLRFDLNLEAAGRDWLPVITYGGLVANIEDGKLDYKALEASLGKLTDSVIDFEWKDVGGGQRRFVIEVDPSRVASGLGFFTGQAAKLARMDVVKAEAIGRAEAERLEAAGQVELANLVGGFVEDHFVNNPNQVISTDKGLDADSHLREMHDQSAEAAKKAREEGIAELEARIPELEALLEEYRGKGQTPPLWLMINLAGSYDRLERLKHPEFAADNKSNVVNVWLDNVHADVSLGNVGEMTKTRITDDVTLGYQTIGLSLKPAGNDYWADLSLTDLVVGARLGGGDLDVSVGHADIKALLHAFTDGKISAWGGLGKDPYANPISVGIAQGAELRDVDVRFKFER